MDWEAMIGQTIGGYSLEELIGQGSQGAVFRGVIEKEGIRVTRAVKLIPKGNLRKKWRLELEKPKQLEGIEGVVQFTDHGEDAQAGLLWIAWTYVRGRSLRSVAKSGELKISVLLEAIELTLKILFACDVVGVEHGDLHAGNLLIQSEDPREIDSSAVRVFVTDFGYLSKSDGSDVLDDYQGLVGIVRECLAHIDFHALEGDEKYAFVRLSNDLVRMIEESNPTEGEHVRSPKALREFVQRSRKLPKGPDGEIKVRRVNDYLAAEHIGERYSEWKELFVPVVLRPEILLSKNTVVLTGARGCGKTMVFRRLTVKFDRHLEGPAKIPGASQIAGFYSNSRQVAEAFAWLPDRKVESATAQVRHFFNAGWLVEVFEYLAESEDARSFSDALVASLHDVLPKNAQLVGRGGLLLSSIASAFRDERTRARVDADYVREGWSLSSITLIDEVLEHCRQHVGELLDKNIVFWLDDFSMPLVSSNIQRILGAIVFRRSKNFVFKVSTEQIETIELVGQNGKSLEQDHDFLLLDVANEALQMKEPESQRVLEEILDRRLRREELLHSRSIGLRALVGENSETWIALATSIREGNPVKYWGLRSFCAMWSGGVRDMISMAAQLADLARQKLGSLDKNAPIEAPIVTVKNQDRVFRGKGAEFRRLLEAAAPPSEVSNGLDGRAMSYGKHLRDVLDAIAACCREELRSKVSKNQGGTPPKQARRIEISDSEGTLSQFEEAVLRSLVLHGVLIPDRRGKSIRGGAVPRYYLRGSVIPHFQLSFSKRDSLMMTWKRFGELLSSPSGFSLSQGNEGEGTGSDIKQGDLF